MFVGMVPDEASNMHVPKPPSITDLYKYFGGKDLDEESDLSQKDNINQSEEKSDGPSLSEKSSLSSKSETNVGEDRGGLETFFYLFKGFVAVGILYLPYGCKDAGWLGSLIVFLVLPILINIGIYKLIECKKKERGSYSEIVARACGKVAGGLVDLLLFALQLFYATASLAFIISNITFLFEKEDLISICIISSSAFLVLFSLVWIQKISNYIIVFVVTDILLIVIFIVIIFFTYALNNFKIKLLPENKYAIPILVGIALFAYEGTGLVIPAFQQIRDKKLFNFAFTACIAIASFFFMVFGVICSVPESNVLERGITYNALYTMLLKNEKLATVFSIIIIVCLLPSYVLTIYPSLRISELLVFGKKEEK
jgi:amino acid transporter